MAQMKRFVGCLLYTSYATVAASYHEMGKFDSAQHYYNIMRKSDNIYALQAAHWGLAKISERDSNCSQGVYPIKVNQQRQVVEEIAEFGTKYDYGLEAGSKPELIAAMAHMLSLIHIYFCVFC